MQWIMDVVANPELDPAGKVPIKALCDVSYKPESKTVKHFVVESDLAKKAPS